MSFIRSIALEEASGRLQSIYQRIAEHGRLDNIITVHGLRPHTLDGHLALYRAALHHGANTLPMVYREAIGVLVSRLNGCAYCVAHHSVGVCRHARDAAHGEALLAALAHDPPGPAFDAREQAGLAYARQLTLAPAGIDALMIDGLRGAGFDDGEILEINQIVGYFCYANRVVLGLGVALEDEGIGIAHDD
ncbi:MAG: carboxymuconolactone decarboxylase family protein [Lysobacterales bacterium]